MRSADCPQGITAEGQTYWFNVQTRKSQWHAPPSITRSLPPPPPPPRQAKSVQEPALEVVANPFLSTKTPVATLSSKDGSESQSDITSVDGSSLVDAKKPGSNYAFLPQCVVYYTPQYLYVVEKSAAHRKRKRSRADMKPAKGLRSIRSSLFCVCCLVLGVCPVVVFCSWDATILL